MEEYSNIEILEIFDRNSEEWFQFVKRQEQRIQTRLNKYNNLETVDVRLEKIDEPSPCQGYKITIVSQMLRQTLDRIKDGKYGRCISCCKNIPVKRLILIPGVSRCINCENSFSSKEL